VRLFSFYILCVLWFSLDYSVAMLFAFVVISIVFFQYYAKRLAGKNVSNDLFCVEKSTNQTQSSFSVQSLQTVFAFLSSF